jgi:hypothetical protein
MRARDQITRRASCDRGRDGRAGPCGHRESPCGRKSRGGGRARDCWAGTSASSDPRVCLNAKGAAPKPGTAVRGAPLWEAVCQVKVCDGRAEIRAANPARLAPHKSPQALQYVRGSCGRTGSDGCLSGAGGARRRGAVPGRGGDAAFQSRRFAGQGSGRKPRTGAGRAGGDGPVAPAQAHHDQPVARRSPEGRQPLRPADRARAAGGDGGDRCRAAWRLDRGGRACAGRRDSRRRPACCWRQSTPARPRPA